MDRVLRKSRREGQAGKKATRKHLYEAIENGVIDTFARDHIRAAAQLVEVVSRNEVRTGGLRSELLRTLGRFSINLTRSP